MFRRILWIMFPLLLLTSFSEAIERRRSQFPRDFGYLIAPIPYILPGVGTGLGVIGALITPLIAPPIFSWLVLGEMLKEPFLV